MPLENMTHPVLSICIPTFNRAHLLRVCLEAVVSQVIEEAGLAELVIADNDSSDNTAAVISNFTNGDYSYPFIRVATRTTNIGPVANVVNLATVDAIGEYALILGDDDLLSPGAVRRITQRLIENRQYDAFYTNFCVEHTSERWPLSAIGGFPCEQSQSIAEEVEDKRITRWVELLRSDNEMGTHIYSHIVRRSIWCKYWRNRKVKQPYSCLQATYPHTAMLLETIANSPAFYLGTPNLTAFYESASWSSNRSKVFLGILPNLLSLAITQGLPKTEHQKCLHWISTLMANEISSCISRNDRMWLHNTFHGLRISRWNSLVISVFLNSIKKVGRKRIAKHLLNINSN
jgi:glycosyltransferase involved in cell wall biosynthesis